MPFDRQLKRGGCTQIIGVVETQRHYYLDDKEMPGVFLARAQSPNVMPFGTPALIVRTRTPEKHAATVRAALQGLRRDLPCITVEPLRESFRSQVLPLSVGATLFSMYGVVAFVLAAIGVYGVLGYFVTERAPEIGIRRSIGAPVGSVVTLVMRQGMVPVGIGSRSVSPQLSPARATLRRCSSASSPSTRFHSSVRPRSLCASRCWPRSCPRGARHGSIR